MALDRWRSVSVGDAVEPVSRAAPVVHDRTYHLLGVRWYGRGCHLHATHSGAALKTPMLNRVVAGDVTYNKMWVTKGAFAVVPPDYDGLSATSEYPLFAVRHGIASPEFLRWAMNTESFVRAATDASRGSTSRRRLNPSDFLGLPLLLPPVGEQRKIAAILSTVDDAIAATQAIINQLQVLKKAMATEFLTRGLPGRHTRFKQTEIGEVPEDWAVVALESCTDDITYGLTVRPAYVDEGIPLVSTKECRDGWIDYAGANKISAEAFAGLRPRSLPKVGDVIITKTGTLGRVARVATGDPVSAISQNVALVRPSSRILPHFLELVLAGPTTRRQIERATNALAVHDLQLGALRQFAIALPSPKEQREIAAIIGSLHERIAQEGVCLAAMTSMKAAVVSVLLTGEVRVMPDEVAA